MDVWRQCNDQGLAIAYADQSEKDNEAVTKAVKAGRLEAVIEKEI